MSEDDRDKEKLQSRIEALENALQEKGAETEELRTTLNKTTRAFDIFRRGIIHYLAAYRSVATRNEATRALAEFLREVLSITPGNVISLRHRDLRKSLDLLLAFIERFVPTKPEQNPKGD